MAPRVRSEDIARYVPAFLARRMVERPEPPTGASGEAAHGAVLFADISGFTALSERLAARGADGVEELTQVLNAYFGRLIEIIVEHGGDVVKFAGDALLAIWPTDSESGVERVARVAARCGRAVQLALQTFTTGTGHRLYLRVGVGAGTFHLASVGGVFQRWEFVVVGPPVLEATLAAGVGETGQVVLGSVAAGHALPVGRGTELAPDFVRLDELADEPLPPRPAPVRVTDAAVPNLLGYVPAAIHTRLAARQSGWLAEMRRLTVLFVNLPGMNHRTPLANSQIAMTALQTELYRFEGSVNKLSTDEKGVTFVAAFGLPPLSHEDDAIRGTLAALAIHAKLTELGWKCSVGVTSGRVFCGTIGSERRCEFTIIGDVVNLSARLMVAAKGGILCDEATHRAGRDRFAWEALPPVQLKGKAHPTPNFRPLGPVRAAADAKQAGEMVGRTRERDRLEVIARKLVDDRESSVVLIEGEAGIGKSTLVSALQGIARTLDLTTWLGAALAIERSTPYFAWRAIYRQLFQLDANDPPESQRRQVLERLAFDSELAPLAPLAPLLDSVLALDFPATAQTADLFGETRASATNALLVRLLARATERAPLQLILEDCHWLDSASWSLARAAAEQVPGLLLALVTRPLAEPLPRDFVPLAALPSTRKLALGPLSIDESLALVRRRLGVADLPESVAELLRAKAQGNPFFLEELAYALRDTGKILVRDGACIVADGQDLRSLAFPDNVQGVVTSRIDRLAPPEQLTLKVASVIGRTFSKNLLRDVSPIEDDKPHLDRHLDTLISQSLTMLDSPDPDPAYSFKHVITQEVSYQMMAPAQRKKLHQVVAEWYERHHVGDLSPYFPLLAKHWSNTDRGAKAIDYLEKSGENALRDCAHEEAVTFFTQALAVAGAAGDRFRRTGWERWLAEAHYHLSDLGAARDHYTVALELVGFPMPRSAAGYVVSGLREFARQQLHRALPSLFRFRKKHDGPRRLEAARAYERLVQIHYLNNAKVPSVHAAFRALNLSESVGECPELARNLSHAAVFSGLLLMHGSARTYAARARDMARRVDQPSCTAYVEFIRGVYWVTVGEWDEAIDNLGRAMEITDRIGEKRRWYESGFTQANALSRRGDFRASVALARRIEEAGTRRGVPQVRVWGLSWQLACLLEIEPASERIAPLAAALAGVLAAHAAIPLADQILGNGVLALARWRRGDADGAKAAADAAEAIISKTNQISHYLPPAYFGLAEVYLGLWDRDPVEMKRRLRQLTKILAEFSLMYPIGKPTALLVKGRYYERKGWKRSAARCYRRSLKAAERYAMPFERAMAHAALGELTGDEAHVRSAKELLERIGEVTKPNV
jgi:class 3 adenylate cyclase/tetratricopeptide (TPR) repeat protein